MVGGRMARFGMIAAGTFAVLGLAGSVLAASFSADCKSENGKKYVSGNKMRLDSFVGSRLQTTVIYRLDKGVMWTIFDVKSRKYVEYPILKGKAWDDLMGIKAQKGKKIGEGTYLGYKCDKYKVITSQTAPIRSKNKVIPSKVTKITVVLWYSPKLKAVVKAESKPTIPGYDSVLTNIKEGPQPASLFELPKGLKKQKIAIPKTAKPVNGSKR